MMTTPLSILVVDDETDHCLNLADILGELDFRVDIAHDGPTALGLAASRAYDAAVLDLAMPGMDGVKLLHRIKRIHPDMPACFVTANTQGNLADEVRETQAGPMLAKPLNVPSLLHWIDGAVDRRRATGHRR